MKTMAFSIAYEVCDYLRSTEMQKQFEDWEFCMNVSEMAHDLMVGAIEQYVMSLEEHQENFEEDDEDYQQIEELINKIKDFK